MPRKLLAAGIASTVLALICPPLSAQQAPLKVGVLMPMSGVLAPLGIEQTNGMRIALEEAGGAVAGRKIELLIEDTEAKPDVGLAKARKLVLSDRVDIMAGIVSSAVALAVAPWTSSQKMPLVISNASTNLISGEKCDRYVIRASYSSAQIGNPIGPYMVKKGIKTAFILASDYVAPHEYVKAFKETFTAAGGKVVGEAFPPFNKTQDYGPYISQARAANPDVIFPIFYGGEAILFMKQYEAFGIKDKMPVYSSMGLVPQMLHKAQGPAALGVTASLNYIPELDTPENKRFVATYQGKHNVLPAEFAVMGYDTLRFIIEGVKARSGDTKDREALIKAIEGVSYVSPRGPVKIDPRTRGATQNVYIARTVQKGSEIGFELLETLPSMADPVTGCELK